MGIVREENKREEKRKEERRSEKRKCQKKKMQVGECRVPSEEHRVSIFFGISSAFSFCVYLSAHSFNTCIRVRGFYQVLVFLP